MEPIDLAPFLLLAASIGLLTLAKNRAGFGAALLALLASLWAAAMLHWQAMVPALAALLLILWAVIQARYCRGRCSRRTRLIACLLTGLAMIASAIPYFLFPMFTWPAPDGPLAVGTTRIELIDPSRRGVLEDPPQAPRHVMAQIWYPARPHSDQPWATYFPSRHIWSDSASITHQVPFFALVHLAAIRTHSHLDAEPASGSFPLFVFNHGYSLYPAQNTPLFEHLASHGYVVVSIGHPYDSSRYTYADGWRRDMTPLVVTPALTRALGIMMTNETIAGWGREFAAYAKAIGGDRLSRSADAWLADTKFVLWRLQQDRLVGAASALARSIDFNRIAYGGMSFGGGVAARACVEDNRCRAMISLDGVSYAPAMFNRPDDKPMLWLYSDWLVRPLFLGEPRNPRVQPMDFAFRKWDLPLATSDYRFRVENAGHLSFTDLARVFGRRPDKYYGTIAPREGAAIVDDFVLAFLDKFVASRANDFPVAELRRHPLVQRHAANLPQR